MIPKGYKAPDMNNRQLRVTCLEFRRGMLGKKKSRGMCAAVSWALHGYLNYIGVETFVREGNAGDWNHVYLQRPDGTVIDATADQFNEPKLFPKERLFAEVYVGRPAWIHTDPDNIKPKRKTP